MASEKPSKWVLHIGEHQIPVSRVVEIDMPKKNIFVEELGDGTFRFTYSKSLVGGAPALNDLNEVEMKLLRRERTDG